MKNLVKVMFGGIVGASVLTGGVALWHMAGPEKDTAGDIEVFAVVVAETCNTFQKDTDAGEQEDTALQECSIMVFRDECTVALGWDAKGPNRGSCRIEQQNSRTNRTGYKDAFEACSSAKV